jgi:type VI secretion system protein ImpK
MLAAESGQVQPSDPAALRQQLMTALQSFATHPATRQLGADEIEDARFALVAWADETLLRSQWPGREQWAQSLMQLELFRTNRGGNEFYEHLARLRPDQSSVREIHLLCLAFGFEGQLADREPERQTLIQQQLEMLRAAGHTRDLAASVPLSPAAYQLEIQLQPRSGSGLPRIILGWAGAAAGLFGLLWSILTYMAASVQLPPGS